MVHWRTTARRGRLMVKELEDEPRDEVAVLLDAAAGVSAGDPPDSSFDMQVRAAGSILRAHARRGRRVALVVNSAGRETLSLRGPDSDWRSAMELLAAAEPNGVTPASSFLGDGSAAGHALDLAVVTARLSPDLVERVVQRAASRRGISRRLRRRALVRRAAVAAGARAAAPAVARHPRNRAAAGRRPRGAAFGRAGGRGWLGRSSSSSCPRCSWAAPGTGSRPATATGSRPRGWRCSRCSPRSRRPGACGSPRRSSSRPWRSSSAFDVPISLGFLGDVVGDLKDGVLAFYDVSLPFQAGEEPLMHGAVLTAIFAFCLVVSLGLAARRPLVSAVGLRRGRRMAGDARRRREPDRPRRADPRRRAVAAGVGRAPARAVAAPRAPRRGGDRARCRRRRRAARGREGRVSRLEGLGPVRPAGEPGRRRLRLGRELRRDPVPVRAHGRARP